MTKSPLIPQLRARPVPVTPANESACLLTQSHRTQYALLLAEQHAKLRPADEK